VPPARFRSTRSRSVANSANSGRATNHSVCSRSAQITHIWYSVHVGQSASLTSFDQNCFVIFSKPRSFIVLCVISLAAQPLSLSLAEAKRVARVASIDEVKVGIGGRTKLGHWTMLAVTFNDSEAGMQLIAKTKDGEGTEAQYRLPVSGNSVRGYVKWGRVESDLRLELVDAEGEKLDERIVVPPPPLLSTHRLIIATGKQTKLAGGMSLADPANRWNGGHSKVEDLPDKWQGYDAVDTLVLVTSRPGTTKSFSEDQFTAMERWLRLGGSLVLIVGTRGDEVFAASSRFRRFLPGEYRGIAEQVRTEKIETCVAAKSPLDRVVKVEETFKFPVCSFGKLQADVQLYETAGTEEDRPLIARLSYGLGRVVLVGFDLDAELFRRWEAYDRLTYQILLLATSGGDQHISKGGRVAHVGYDDVMGQLRGALDQFAGVKTIAFSIVALLIVCYVLIIGPIDFWVLRKLGWERVTWVTLPLTTIVFCAIAVWLYGSSKTNSVQVNQVDLVDIDMKTGTVRGTSWSHIYSGSGDTYDLRLDVKTPIVIGSVESMLSWHGMPGRGLGGLSNPSFSPGGQPKYTINTNGQGNLQALPVHVAGTKSLIGRWWSQQTFDATAFKLKENRDGMLDGQLRWGLPVSLESAILLYRNWAYYIRFPVKPGTNIFLRELPSPKHFDWRLTKRFTIAGRNITTPWDSDDVSDLPRIMEIMMFFKMAGGRNYTNLSHRYQSFVDLTELLSPRQAILLGTAKQRATELAGVSKSKDRAVNASTYDNSWSFYRIIVPVQRR